MDPIPKMSYYLYGNILKLKSLWLVIQPVKKQFSADMILEKIVGLSATITTIKFRL